jgi:hypothetical protein
MNNLIDMEAATSAVKGKDPVKLPLLQPIGAGNVLPRDLWSDPSGSLTRRTAIFKFPLLFTGVTNDTLAMDIFHTEILALKVFGALMFRRLLEHTMDKQTKKHAGYGSWQIPYFKDENDRAKILENPVVDFLTNPQMGKAGSEYHFEYRRGARVTKKDFDHKFDCFMQFEKKQPYEPSMICGGPMELALGSAAASIIAGPAPVKGPDALKLVEFGWFECKHCHQDIDTNYGQQGHRADGPPADTCCSAFFKDTRPKSGRKNTDTKAIRHSKQRVTVPFIKNLALVDTATEPTRNAPMTYSAVPWDHTCKCERIQHGRIVGNETAVLKTTSSDNIHYPREYYACMKGICGFFLWADEAPPSGGQQTSLSLL